MNHKHESPTLEHMILDSLAEGGSRGSWIYTGSGA